MFQFSEAALSLSKLLGVRYVPDSRAQAGAIGQSLADVLRFHNAGRYVDRDMEIWRLRLLAKQLREVQAGPDPAVMSSFKRRLRANPVSDYYGARQEIVIARRLIREQIPFEHELTGCPDFSISFEGGTSGIECTSAHLTTGSHHGDLSYKIRSRLHDKARKPYASNSVAIAFDTTTLAAHSGIVERHIACHELARTPFGSLVLFTVLLNCDLDPPRFEQNYVRVDAPNIADDLLKVLDVAYPRGNHTVRDYHLARAP